jgi:hypothetical protein
MRATPNRRGQPQRERPAGHLDPPCRVTGRNSSEQEAAVGHVPVEEWPMLQLPRLSLFSRSFGVLQNLQEDPRMGDLKR